MQPQYIIQDIRSGQFLGEYNQWETDAINAYPYDTAEAALFTLQTSGISGCICEIKQVVFLTY